MKTLIFYFALGLPILIMFMLPNASRAQAPAGATGSSQTQNVSVSPGQENVANKIGNDFSSFLANVDSRQVATDLRNGQWTKTTFDPVSNTPTTTTESLPTGKMGWGNVKISLALAQHSLSQQGITQPTSEQLYTSLMGGEMVAGDTTTMTKGVLQLRSEGMGWGEIAQQYNTKLGPLMSGIKGGKQPVTTATTSTTSRGITTASGKSSGDGSLSATGKGHGKAFAGSKSHGNGIVSASGRSAGATSSSISHSGRGIVTGSGRSVGATSGVVTGGGRGHAYGVSGGGSGSGGGHGKGHNK